MNNLSDNYPMVMFGEDWAAHPSSSQHLARELSKFHDITWINSIGLRSPKFTLTDMARAVNKLKAVLTFNNDEYSESSESYQYQKDSWKPEVINPLAIPFHGQEWARWVNKRLISNKLFDVFKKNKSQDLAKEKPILWLSLPSAVPLLGNIHECFSIYYCGDDFSSLEGVDHDVIEKLEAELVDKVDLILVASEELSKKFPKDKTIFIPHGVANYFYEAPDERPKDLPEGPVAGFYGSLSGWVDQQLLIRTARKMPHWNFVIIGPQRCFVEHLRREPNIYLLGKKDHRELPNYIHHWQVSLLPFINNAQIRACNPLKLREYMAVGKPIVSTDFPALKPYEDWITIAGHDDFCHAIESAAAEVPKAEELILTTGATSFFSAIEQWGDIEEMRRIRQKRASQVESHTWQARALKVESEILKRIQLEKVNMDS
jgi:glycosyltransferase involved in cell wall biosynthesis